MLKNRPEKRSLKQWLGRPTSPIVMLVKRREQIKSSRYKVQAVAKVSSYKKNLGNICSPHVRYFPPATVEAASLGLSPLKKESRAKNAQAVLVSGLVGLHKLEATRPSQAREGKGGRGERERERVPCFKRECTPVLMVSVSLMLCQTHIFPRDD